MASIDIIIVTYNAKTKLKRCLNSIRKYTRSIPYALTIVDNHSTDGTSEFLKAAGKNANVITNAKNLGFSRGVNVALRSTSGQYIALVDDDAEVTKHWLRKLFQRINENVSTGIVGCKIVSTNHRIFSAEIDLSARCYQGIGHGEIDRGQCDYVKEVASVNGACWLMRRAVVKQIGLYDERFFPCQCEDIDYCLRAIRAGFKIVYDGTVSIIHHHLYRSGGIKTMMKNFGKFIKKWGNFKEFDDLKKQKHYQTEHGTPKIKHSRAKGFESGNQRPTAPTINRLKKAIYLEPYDYVSRHMLAMAYKKRGHLKKAKLEAHKSLEIFSAIGCKKAHKKQP